MVQIDDFESGHFDTFLGSHFDTHFEGLEMRSFSCFLGIRRG